MSVAFATNRKARPEERAEEVTKPVPVGFVTIEGRALAKAMQLMLAVVERRNTYPILGNVRLAVESSTLTVTGSDLDIVAIADLDVIDAGGEWSTTVDCRALAAIARVSGVMPMRMAPTPGDTLRIAVGDGDASYELPELSDESFPSIPGERGALLERFTNGQLPAILGKVAPCISTEETRYYLNGVAWQFSAEGRRMSATDGHRMAVCGYQGKFSAPTETRIIPTKVVSILRRFTSGADVSLHAVDNVVEGVRQASEKIDVTWPGFSMRAKLIEGTYPDIDRVRPRPEQTTLRLSLKRIEAIAAVERVSIFGGRHLGRFASVALRVARTDAGRLVIGTKNPDYGSAECVLSAAWPEAKVTEFGLNGRYLAELLAGCQGDVVAGIVDAGAPITITDEDETMSRILMPMRV